VLIEEYAVGWAYHVAEAHGARGEVDEAFDWLDRGYALRDVGLTELKISPRSLHADPRWGAFLKNMGLQD